MNRKELPAFVLWLKTEAGCTSLDFAAFVSKVYNASNNGFLLSPFDKIETFPCSYLKDLVQKNDPPPKKNPIDIRPQQTERDLSSYLRLSL